MRFFFFTFPFKYSHMERNLDSAPSLQVHCYYNVRHPGKNAANNDSWSILMVNIPQEPSISDPKALKSKVYKCNECYPEALIL